MTWALSGEGVTSEGWRFQAKKDAAYILLGMAALYVCNMTFTHIRFHKLISEPDSFSYKHIAFASACLLSCAHIIASVLR